TQGYDSALAETSLRVKQVSQLVMVHHLGPPTMKNHPRLLDSDRMTIKRNIQGLSKRQLLTLSPGQRLLERKVILTKLGRTMLMRAFPNWRKAQNNVVASLNREELTKLRALLEQVGQHKKRRDPRRLQ